MLQQNFPNVILLKLWKAFIYCSEGLHILKSNPSGRNAGNESGEHGEVERGI